MTQTEAFVALNMLPRIGPVRVRKLLEVFGSPQAIFEAKPRDLRHVQGIGPEVAEVQFANARADRNNRFTEGDQ
jgi:DNA processing protein